MAKNYIERVAIVGAGGHVGKYIVDELLKTGKHTVTAITRTDYTATFPSGVQIKKVNYSDQSSLVSALQGQDAIIITLSVFAPPDTQTKLIEAAASAKVPWILPNEFGQDPLNVEMGRDNFLGVGKAKNRVRIEELGVSSWIAIASGFWYEWSLAGGPYRYGFDFKEKSVGRAVAALLSLKVEPEGKGDVSLTTHFKNKPAYISSFTIGQTDMLKSVLRVTGDKMDDWKVTKVPVKEYYKNGVEEFQKRNRMAFGKLLYSRTFFPDSSGDFESMKGLHNDILGLPKEDLDDATSVTVPLADIGFD